ncbi:hypothetical protein ASE52_10745 [Acidovorax sp. Root275]|nr:hypothetical protein ASE52_10745 [Acidovorax sp. Root275]
MRCVGGNLVRRRCAATFLFHLGTLFFLILNSLQAVLIEIASPDHDLVGIADVIDRRDLAAGELFAILMGQYLQFGLRTVRAALGAQSVYAVQAVVAHPSADLLLRHRPLTRQQLRPTIPSQKLITTLSLNPVWYFS